MILFGYAEMAMSARMPWERPLCELANAFRGPTAVAISSIAFFAAGASFVFGEEIAGVSKKMVGIFMAICIMIGAPSLVGWIAQILGYGSASCAM